MTRQTCEIYVYSSFCPKHNALQLLANDCLHFMPPKENKGSRPWNPFQSNKARNKEAQIEVVGSEEKLGRLPLTPTIHAKTGGKETISKNDIIILVLGPTGSGKSTFINLVTGLGINVGCTLASCTSTIQTARLSFPDYGGRDIVLVDTPGFDDTNKTDADTLKTIVDWWMEMYHQDILLSGLLYFHRISDNRIGGTCLKNLEMFKVLCGNNPLQRMILMTTMWDQVDEKYGETQEMQMQKDYWSGMPESGTTARLMGTRESALSILTPFILKAIQGKMRLALLSTMEAKVVEKESLSKKDVIIAVMGPTGSGKSTFIKIATGLDPGVGHSLESRTSTVNTITLSFPEYSECNVVFVDTPGFDDTKKPDAEILQMIATWLQETYGNDVRLAGLLYCHRITDNRMAGTPKKNLKMFKALCGKGRYKDVILVTTMWDQEDVTVGNTRETELKKNYWRDMIGHHAKTARFENTRESAFQILGPLIDKAIRPESVLIQDEMIDMKLQLPETLAGQALYEKLVFQVAERQKILKQCQSDLDRPDIDEASFKDTEIKYRDLQKEQEDAMSEMQKMRLSFGERWGMKFSVMLGQRKG
ncbi:P-loop containing nucleoside triphosphate hydrolase protein [Crassisporium funariophilum]|nr:P-loop containing nucleoside triphosphate hydrolase protein [Crassisporium funariophilum]